MDARGAVHLTPVSECIISVNSHQLNKGRFAVYLRLDRLAPFYRSWVFQVIPALYLVP